MGWMMLMDRLSNLVSFLTEPHPSVVDLLDRRRAKLLAGLLIFVLPLGLASSYASPVGEGLPFLVDIELRIHAVALSFWGMAYFLSRSRFYKVDIWLTAIL
jgi:hypothetical protein